MARILGYARVSTQKQEDEGLSLDAQRRRLIDAGATEVLSDVMSGAKDDRPAFRELLRRVRAREVDVVIVCKLDRLTRSITARAEIYEAFTAPGAPVLRALDDGIDLGTASGRQIFDIQGAIATGERERIRERIRDGLAERRKRGLFVGQVPWGLRLTRTGVGVEIDPELEPQVRAVLRILASSTSLGNATRQLADQLGLKRNRSSWRTWLRSPQLSGALPTGCRDQRQRVYDSIQYRAFTSYLTPVEHEALIAKFEGEARGKRSNYPHPCRNRVFCGECGRALQRRVDRKMRPRWMHCVNDLCSFRGRTVPVDVVLDSLVRAAFFYGRQRLQDALALQNRTKEAKADPREAELIATLAALRALPADVVEEAIAKAERELATLRQNALMQSGLESFNLERTLNLLEFLSDWSQEDPTPEDLERLGDLIKVVGVKLTTKQSPTLHFNGRPRIVLDKACMGNEQIDVLDLPPLQPAGGSFEWRELAAALQLGQIPLA